MTRVEIAAPAFVQVKPDIGSLASELFYLHIPGGAFATLFSSESGKWILESMGEKACLGPTEILSAEDAQRIAVSHLLSSLTTKRRYQKDPRRVGLMDTAIIALERLRALYPDPEPF